jgi:acyl-homoserine-lactone acylase
MRILLFSLLVSLTSLVSSQVNPKNVTIARDSYGVPHIFAATDQEVAYGVAWATAEDDFNTIQEQMLAARGKLGLVNGPDGAALDIAFQLIQAKDLADRKYESDISPEFKKLLEAYAQGLNDYAEAHPKEVQLKGVFPVGPKDIIQGYILGTTFITSARRDLQQILTGKIVNHEKIPNPEGSNAFAVSRKRTKDGKTYLAINSHQPLEGLYSWYEIHVCSEEGWNFLGGTFPGGVTPFVGTNENLGWAMTVNYPDLSDVYKLEMHPSEPLLYLFDGKWEKLTEITAKTKVKLLGFLKLGVKRKVFESKHGITFKTKDGYYALRIVGNRELRAPEQYYQMTKAHDFASWRKALDIQGLISTNIVYADREDNIFYISNGKFPIRERGFDWQYVMPGNTSKNLWAEEYYPVDSLAQVKNPQAGYIYNCNNSPFLSTDPAENPDPELIPETMGYQAPHLHTNRSFRLAEQLAGMEEKIDYDEFKRIKYDLHYGKPAVFFAGHKLEKLFNLDPEAYPDIKEEINLLANWDRKMSLDSEAGGLFLVVSHYLVKEFEELDIIEKGVEIPEKIMVVAIEQAKKHLQKHFKTNRIALGEIQRHQRGEVDLPVQGGPDILAAAYGAKQKDGRFKIYTGDSYIELVRYSDEGVEIESVNAYGASAKPDSPHFTDQMELYTQQKVKKMTLDKETILKEAKRVYHPGE